jgi:hypothetical protein
MVPKTDDKIQKLTDQKSVVKFEFNNFSHIILYKSGKDFWNATMHSALFLKYILKSRSKFNFTIDRYYSLQQRVYIAYHASKINAVKQKIKAENYQIVRDDPTIFVFTLKKPPLETDLDAWKHDLELQEQKINAYYLPNGGLTTAYSLLLRLGAELTVMNRHMNEANRQSFSHRLTDYLVEMVDIYHRLSARDGTKHSPTLVPPLLYLIDRFSFLMQVAYNDKALSHKRMLLIGQILSDFKKELQNLYHARI